MGHYNKFGNAQTAIPTLCSPLAYADIARAQLSIHRTIQYNSLTIWLAREEFLAQEFDAFIHKAVFAIVTVLLLAFFSHFTTRIILWNIQLTFYLAFS